MWRCKECGEEKPISCFHRNKRTGWPSRKCNDCIPRLQKYCVDCGTPISFGARERCRPCRDKTQITWDQPCQSHGCHNKRGKWGRNGYCAKHYQQIFKTHRGTSRRLTSDGISEAFPRSAVFERDGGPCRYCGKRVGKTWHLAHLIALANGGDNTFENVAVSCPSCNLRDGTGRLPVQLHLL